MTDFASDFTPGTRRPSPGRLQRRRLAVDLALGATIATVALLVTDGLGVVAWFAVPIMLICLLSVAVERVLGRRRARRARRHHLT